MNEDEIAARVHEALIAVVPEAEGLELAPDQAFRDQVELDSVDYLGYVLRLEQEFSIRIPEIDYPKLSSLRGAVGYLKANAMSAPPPR